MKGESEHLSAEEQETFCVKALEAHVAWCGADRIKVAINNSGKIFAVQYFHRVDRQVKSPIHAPLVKRNMLGDARAHAQAGTKGWVRSPIS